MKQFLLIFSTFILFSCFHSFAADRKTKVKFLKDTVIEVKNVVTYDKYFLDVSSDKGWGVALSGWISNDFFIDSRKMEGSRDNLLGIYPLAKSLDIDGNDINARPNLHFLALNTRVRIKITTPDVLKAKVTALVEGWFAGVNEANVNGFALRHAYFNFSWKNKKPFQSDLLIGQTWHPLFTEHIFPKVVSPNAGLPFNAFSRQPQIRYTQQLKDFRLLTYLNTQLDFSSPGLFGRSTSYIGNSLMPQMGLQAEYKTNIKKEEAVRHEVLVGVGVDYKNIMPRELTSAGRKTNKRVSSVSAIAYLNYKHFLFQDVAKSGFIQWTTKATYGQNVPDMTMLGGYAIKQNENGTISDDYEWTVLQNFAIWSDLSVTFKKVEIGVFGGYIKNLGSIDKIYKPNNPNSYFARAADIDQMIRTSVRVKYDPTTFLQIGFETELTQANYAKMRNDFGLKIGNTSNVYNVRFLVNCSLFF